MIHSNTSRLSIDIPCEIHTHLKMEALKKRVSMKDYILEALSLREESTQKDCDLDNSIFRKGLKKALKEHSQLIKSLSKK